jgi:light-regulated signal transduction histidine kinase (bacteriophytochrome)
LADFSWEIVERKRAQEKIERYADEMERSNEDLEQCADVISHDLREPARMVKSYMELLENRYRGKMDDKADMFIRLRRGRRRADGGDDRGPAESLVRGDAR